MMTFLNIVLILLIKQDLRFQAKYLLRRRFACNIKPYFQGKYETRHQYVSSAAFVQRMPMVNIRSGEQLPDLFVSEGYNLLAFRLLLDLYDINTYYRHK